MRIISFVVPGLTSYDRDVLTVSEYIGEDVRRKLHAGLWAVERKSYALEVWLPIHAHS